MGILDMLFGKEEAPEEVTERCRQTIVDLLPAMGHKKGESWDIGEEGRIIFFQGSAGIFIDFDMLGERPCVAFLSPIVKLPADNLLPFYRHLLELNQTLCGLVSLGVENDVVYVCTQRSLASMTELSLTEAIDDIGSCADDLDDLLHQEFEAPFYDPEDSR